MTKAKAIKQMREYSRAVIEPQFANKIAKAFGYTLKDLGLKAMKTENHHRINYTEETASLKSIAVYKLAMELAKKITGKQDKSTCFGMGSYADHTTELNCNLIENN